LELGRALLLDISFTGWRRCGAFPSRHSRGLTSTWPLGIGAQHRKRSADEHFDAVRTPSPVSSGLEHTRWSFSSIYRRAGSLAPNSFLPSQAMSTFPNQQHVPAIPGLSALMLAVSCRSAVLKREASAANQFVNSFRPRNKNRELGDSLRVRRRPTGSAYCSPTVWPAYPVVSLHCTVLTATRLRRRAPMRRIAPRWCVARHRAASNMRA